MRVLLFSAAFVLSGCAQTTYWLKDGGSQDEFNRTQAACHNQAYFLPQTMTPRSAPSYQIAANVSPSGQVRATATPFRSPYQDLSDGLNAWADLFGNIAKREQFVFNCMVANGWQQIAASDISLTVDTYALVGSNPTVEYHGKATGYLDGSGTINIQNAQMNQCVGSFRYNASRTGGTGVVRCNDGDAAEIAFTPINKSSGFGGGTTAAGKPIRFVYGVPPDQRERYLKGK